MTRLGVLAFVMLIFLSFPRIAKTWISDPVGFDFIDLEPHDHFSLKSDPQPSFDEDAIFDFVKHHTGLGILALALPILLLALTQAPQNKKKAAKNRAGQL